MGAAVAWPELAGLRALLVLAAAAALVVAAVRSARRLEIGAVVALAALAIIERPTQPAVGMFVLIGATLLLLPPAPGDRSPWGLSALRGRPLVELLLESPARLLVGSFVLLATLGTGFLLVPASTTSAVAPLDAAFTAVSAACVTGLAVLDTPVDFTRFGQGVLLVLIQLGGLGIMTVAAAASVALGRRLRLREERLAADLVGGDSTRHDLESAIRWVLRVTLVTELIGAGVLSALFLAGGDGASEALWKGLFTAVSAFCNAGFALDSDSLVSFQERPLVLLVVSVIIIIGSLGPVVVAALPHLRRRASLQVRIVVATTALLLLLPFGAILILEWSNTLGDLGFGDKLVNAWFQSVTLRTAGFNSVDLGAVHPATWTLMVFCMFVGGSPGSTAGGIKTTTLAVMSLAVAAAVQGRKDVEVFGRRILPRTVYEASAITALGAVMVAGTLIALQLTQTLELEVALFEVVSALATVGLTTGGTGQLDAVGKAIVILAMFAGRVGPLTLFVLLVGPRRQDHRRLPPEPVQVG